MTHQIYTKEDMYEAFQQGMNLMLFKAINSEPLKLFRNGLEPLEFDEWLNKYNYENKIEISEEPAKPEAKPEIFEMDAYDFNQLVEKHYGGSFEFEAIEEANHAHYKYEVDEKGAKLTMDFGECEKIRAGKYPMYCTNHVFKCLFEDGHIKAGTYLIDNRN